MKKKRNRRAMNAKGGKECGEKGGNPDVQRTQGW